MPRELSGYRDEIEHIISVLGDKGFYSTSEIALLDYGPAPDPQTHKANLRSVRIRYGIDARNRGLTRSALARKRAAM